MSSPEELSTGAKYRALSTLAVGGMGRVDLARRREGNFERLFAIKRPRPELANEPEVRAMFLDETRIAGMIRHPNVVSIVDLGEDEDGPFAVMELVEGISVATLLERRQVQPLPLEIALRIAIAVAEGLHAAHELVGPDGTRLELVHRDVSPANILLGFDGVARVTDFGVAKALGRVSKTSTGVLKGKLGYISPEQLRFEEPDRRADLFALGVVLFELLTGQRLYRSKEGMDGPRRILTEPPPDLGDYRTDAEPELVALLFELLAKAREARPATAQLVARRLEAILAVHSASGEAQATADFLARHFSDEKAAWQKRLVAARAALSEPPPAGGKSTRARGKRLAVFAFAALALGLGFAYAQSHEAPPEATPLALPSGAASGPVAEALPSGIVTSGAQPAVVEPAPAEPRTTSSVATPVGAAHPRARVAPKPAAAKSSKPGVPMWERY